MEKSDEAYWNFIQLFAWVHTRDWSLVLRASELVDEDETLTEKIESPSGGSKVFINEKRIVDLFPIFVESAFKGLSDKLYKETMTDIWTALQEGRLSGSGLSNNSGVRRDIKILEWVDLEIDVDIDIEPLRVVPKDSTRIGATTWHEVRFPRAEILNIWPDLVAAERGQGTAGAETKCLNWLVELMRAGSPTKPKSGYSVEAQDKFGDGLSSRAFQRAWANAIQETGNLKWKLPGRKKKSNSMKDCAPPNN